MRRLLVYQHKGVLLATLAKTPSGVSTEGSQLTAHSQELTANRHMSEQESSLLEFFQRAKRRKSLHRRINSQEPTAKSQEPSANSQAPFSHADSTDYTEDSCLAGNINLTQNTQNSQKASRCALAGLHRGFFYRTQINFVESRLRSLGDL